MSLRSRLAVLVMLAVAVLVAVGGVLFLNQLQRGLDASLDTTLRARAEAIVQRIGPDGNSDFQDSGKIGLLPPDEALAQIVDSRGHLSDFTVGTKGEPLLSAAQLARARVGPLALTASNSTGDSVRLLAVPVAGSGHVPTVVVVGTTRALSLDAVARVRTGLLAGGGLGVALSGAGAWLLAGAALRPVERMRRQAAHISVDDSGARLAVPATRDEIARLGDTMNALLGRLQRALSRQQEFVADAGHELRTPLTILRSELELAGRPGRSREELTAAISRAVEETDRVIRLAEDLLLLARVDSHEPLLTIAPLRLDEVVADAVYAATPRASTADVQIQLDLATPAVVLGDRDRFRQVIDNLLDNAIRFAPAASTITVAVLHQVGGSTVVEVDDSGPGFPDEFLQHAFERFRRADPSRGTSDGGAGLGLAIVASLVRAHGGAVAAMNRPAGGARIRIELPTFGARRLVAASERGRHNM
ncbi:MAG: sensor histidine kinase [Nocardioidaceae bacterium]